MFFAFYAVTPFSQAPTIVANSSVVIPACEAASISCKPRSPDFASAPASPSIAALKGCVVFHSGWAGAKRPDSIQCENELKVQRLFGPQRAVVVEDRNALCRLHIVGAALARDARNELDEGLLSAPRRSMKAAVPR